MKTLTKVSLVGLCMAAMLAVVVGCTAPASGPAETKEAAGEAETGSSVEFSGGALFYDAAELVVMVDGDGSAANKWTSAVEGASVKEGASAAGKETDAKADKDAGDADAGQVFEYKAEGSGDATITLKQGEGKTVTLKATVENGAFKKVTAQ